MTQGKNLELGFCEVKDCTHKGKRVPIAEIPFKDGEIKRICLECLAKPYHRLSGRVRDFYRAGSPDSEGDRQAPTN